MRMFYLSVTFCFLIAGVVNASPLAFVPPSGSPHGLDWNPDA